MLHHPPEWTPPESSIQREHFRVLEEAIANAEEFPLFGSDVHKALNYFTARLNRQGGVNLFLYGMKHHRIDCLRDGLKLIKKHAGGR